MCKQQTGEILGKALKTLGTTRAYGVVGGGVAPLIHGLQASGVELVHTRHESGAAFAACEEYHAKGNPAIVWTTTGPGFANVINGMAAVSWEGAKAFLLAGATPLTVPEGQAFQDTRAKFLGALSNLAAPQARLNLRYVQSPGDLYRLLDEWRAGVGEPGAFIAAALIPLEMQEAFIEPWVPREVAAKRHVPKAREDVLASLARDLESGTTLIWAGFGARRASGLLSELVARLPARVISSPRGKGVFPETHPAYVGVSGHGGHERLSSFLKANQVDTLLVLGTRLHELTSYWDSSFSPRKRMVHVDCRAGALGDGFFDIPTLGIQAEIGEFLKDLLAHVNGTPQNLPAQETGSFVEYRPEGEGPGIHPADLMEMVQLEVVEGRDIPVMAEAGFAWSWAAHCLRFDTPRFRVSTTWGSMGHFSAGVLGAALATQKPAMSLVGDGAMLMQNEVSTAVAYRVPAKWLVLNNRGYGTIRHGLAASGFSPMELDIPQVHFADWATAQGATGLAVATKEDLRFALREAIASPGPVVIDAHVDSSVRPPFGRRIECLVSNYGTWRT